MDSPLYEGLWPSVIAAIISSLATITSAIIVARSSTTTLRRSEIGDLEGVRGIGLRSLQQGHYAQNRSC
ncbi:hypothetical protein F5Y10DRAFT_249069 [Nemania abortiva]|nr:hypothetical protein F5Y10DRAFT_249069 [Nemania abortiva]